MTDTIIKGSGNSRHIKSVPNLAALAPTYDKLLELLTGEGLPIDLGPLNEAGLNVRGTDLNKASLLKDATAALYGLGTGAVPDDVLAKIPNSIEVISKLGNCGLYSTSYTGTGKAGKYENGVWVEYAKTLYFPHKPMVVFVNSDNIVTAIINGQTRFHVLGFDGRPGNALWSNKNLSFYTGYGDTYAAVALNAANQKYLVLALLDMKQ